MNSGSIVECAQQEARARGDNFIGTEHILLGVLEAGGIGASLLNEHGITLDAARNQADKLATTKKAPSAADRGVPFSPRSKRIADTAANLAKDAGSDEVLSEHWLLAVLSEGDGLAIRILEQLEVKPSELRSDLLKKLSPKKKQKQGAFKVDTDGFALAKEAVSEHDLNALWDRLEPLRQSNTASAGLRHLLQRSESVRDFAYSDAVLQIAISVLHNTARPVRAILFDKTPESNWYVTWHQDVTISVKERIDVPGYGPWSTKSGVLHVQPPAEIMENMVALRIHFDDTSVDNGAINFIPGSHKAGILDREGVAMWRAKRDAVACPAMRGDIVIMRPLILHSSPVAKDPSHRRVLHIEYTGAKLPDGLQWAEA